MKEREKNLLNYIIKEHIRTAEPVGSDLLVERYNLKMSPATIRGEMAELEKSGYLTHPYTSAGRIPTEKGYYFYLENHLKVNELSEKVKNILKRIRKQTKKSPQFLLKEMAKALAELSEETVLVAFSPEETYFSGFSHLFNQPEFGEPNLVRHFSQIIDNFDEEAGRIFNQVDEEIKILIGNKNPFSNKCSVVITKYHFSNNSNVVIGILGPMRMDYENNAALLKYIKDLLNN